MPSALAEIQRTPSIAGFAFRGYEPTGVWPFVDAIQIRSLTADIIQSGTISVVIDVGDGSITIDGETTQIVVNDGTRDRVIIGDLGSDYGLEIYNSAGTLMWSATSGAQTAGIAAGSITGVKIGANEITAAKIAANTITAAEIAANAITADELAASSVTAGKIAAGAVTANSIGTGSLTAEIDITSGVIRTAASGERAQMDTLGYGVYDSNGDRVIDIDENGLRFQTKTTANAEIDSIRWFRQGAGDTNPFAEVIAAQNASAAQIHVLARPRTSGQAASAIARLAAQDEAGNIRAKIDASGSTDAAENQYVEMALKATDGTDQTRVKIDQDKIDLDSDWDGSTRGRIRVFKGAQGSGERITMDGHVKFNDGIIYPSAKEVSFGNIAAGAASTVAVTYDVAFTGANAPYPVGTLQDWDGTIRIAHGGGDGNAATSSTTTGCDYTVSNFAGSTTSTDVRIFIMPIGAS